MQPYRRYIGLSVTVANLVCWGTAQAATDYTQTVEDTPGLLAYYQFSGNTSSSVNGYTGSLTSGASIGAPGSGPVLADSPGNQALNLNGTVGNELLSSLSSGISTSGTVIAWINLAELPSTANRIFYIAGESAGDDDLDLQVETDNNIYFYTDTGGSVATSTPLTAADLGTYLFVAATFTANTDRNLYINGSLVNSNVPGNHSDSSNPFTIGYSNLFDNRSFDGDIDEVAFYNTDITASQISAIYESSTVVPEPACFALLVMTGIGILKRHRRM